MSEYRVFTSTKGKPKLAYHGYSYRRSNQNINSTNWRCDFRGCKGSIATSRDYITCRQAVNVLQQHCHVPDPARIEALLPKDQIKVAASVANDAPRRILGQMLAGVSEEAASKTPQRKSLSRMIQRHRHRKGGFEPAPSSNDFVIPERYKTVSHGSDEVAFLLHDDFDLTAEEQCSPHRAIVFASRYMLNTLQQSSTWMLDGTFKVAPSQFYQFFTIHAVLDDYVVPCVYALLPNKRSETYRRLFKILKANQNGLQPQHAVIDFEIASKNALEGEFPGIKVSGCYFHLCQSIWRSVQRFGISEQYTCNNDVRKYVKMLCALAFLPLDEVVAGYDELNLKIQEAELPEGLSHLYQYFEDCYIGRQNVGTADRSKSKFEISMWNVKDRTESGIPRTNNRLKGWHSGIQRHFDCDHPSIWRFLQALKQEEMMQYLLLQQRIAGMPAPPTEKRYRELNLRLERLIQSYKNQSMTRMEFVQGVAFNISLCV